MEHVKSGDKIIACPRCQARYRLSEKDFPKGHLPPVLCTKCGAVFEVDPITSAALTPSSSEDAPQATALTRGTFGLPEGKVISISVLQGPEKGKVFRLTKPYVVVGRREGESTPDIAIDDPKISRRHCSVEVHESTALLVDLGSTNGTFVDEKKIETSELEHLSEFRVGSSVLLFSVTSEA